MPRLMVIAIGGVLGSTGRYAIALVFGEHSPAYWPWATFTVNLLGALAIGVVATSRLANEGPEWVRPFAITGVLGGFTTFSAFALETGVMLDAGHAPLAAAYLVATMAAGLVAVRVGVAIGRPR